ncbi:hypothetical protein L1887_59204 [Cichorium endivia]|nr:hypothetical protein L1887_59204 [Cichorium endivia]
MRTRRVTRPGHDTIARTPAHGGRREHQPVCLERVETHGKARLFSARLLFARLETTPPPLSEALTRCSNRVEALPMSFRFVRWSIAGDRCELSAILTSRSTR